MPDPRWLTTDQQERWRSIISVCALLPDRLDRDLAQGHQLSLAEYEVLVRLSESPRHSMRMSELADATLSSRSRLSHQITRMEKTGLVRREECFEDRRGWLAVMTDLGFTHLERAAPDHVESVRRQLIDVLSPEEFEELGRICGVIAHGLQRTPQTDDASDCR